MINELTLEQKKLLPVYRDKWLKIGLSTEPGDEAIAEQAIKDAYAVANLDPPQQIIWHDSPLSLVLADVIVGDPVRKLVCDSVINSVCDSVINSVCDSVINSVRDSVRDSIINLVRDSVRNSVRDSIINSVWNLVRDSIINSVGDPVRKLVINSVESSVWNLVRDSVESSIRNSVRDSIIDSVEDPVWNLVRDSVIDSVWNLARDSVWNLARDSVFGSQDAYWLGFYDYFREVLMLNCCDKLLPLSLIAQHCSWWIPRENICFISRKPTICSVNESGQLHNLDGPAIAYKDGFEIFAIDGYRVPRKIVEAPETQSIAEINSEMNIEIKRIRISQFGWKNFLEQSNAKIIDSKSVVPSYGNSWLESLYLCPNTAIAALVTYCPSTGTPYFLEVPPTTKTCKEAQQYLLSPENILQGTGFNFPIKTYPKLRT